MDNQNELKGLGGWLILVGIGVIIAPIRILVTYVPMYWPLFNNGTWEMLTTAGSQAYHPIWGPLLVGEIVFNSVIVAVSIYLIYLFFTKHYLFPRIFLAVIAVSIVFIPLDAWLVSLAMPSEKMFDPDTTKEFARALLGGLIWGPYMLMSKRVKATFVEKKPDAEVPLAAGAEGD